MQMAGERWSYIHPRSLPDGPRTKPCNANYPVSNRLGILSMVLCFALGIANIFTIHPLIIIFSIICLYVSLPTPSLSPAYHSTQQPTNTFFPPSVFSFIILFIEVPLLLRICPTSSSFDAAIRRVSTNYMRAGAYAVMAVVQWLSLIVYATSLIAAAVFLSITAVCYLLAAVKKQAFVGSKTLGGQGVAQMIV